MHTLGSRSYGYNNQGLLTTVNNAFGVERQIEYDVHDAAVSLTIFGGPSYTRPSLRRI